MPRARYRIVYEKGGIRYKLCRLFFGPDGSYYVTSPYHPSGEAVLMKMTVNYAHPEMAIPLTQAIDIASVDDDEKRLKLSHHPDGFLQFSGPGITSGRDTEGNIRGIGVMSWPLDAPILGPAFALAVRGVEKFEQESRPKGETCTFRHEELTPTQSADLLILEGYYFPPRWRRFVRTEADGSKSISIIHPAHAVLKLKVVLLPENCPRPGFIGLHRWARALSHRVSYEA